MLRLPAEITAYHINITGVRLYVTDLVNILVMWESCFLLRKTLELLILSSLNVLPLFVRATNGLKHSDTTG